MQALILIFICSQVGGEVDDVKRVKVMEGGVLNLHPTVADLKGDIQILWTFKSASQSTRVAQLYQGKIYTHYDERFTGRVQLDQETGLTITGIRTEDSGLYKVVIIVNKKITVQLYKVDVYAPVSVPTISSSSSVSVPQCTGTSQASQVSNSTMHLQTREFYPNNQDSVQHCGEAEVLIRLVLSGLVGFATVVFLVEHIRCCTAQRGAHPSV